jgi:hypothetical protein
LLNAAATFVTTLLPFAHRATEALPSAIPAGETLHVDQFAGFHQWTLEKKIESASVIVMTVHKEENGKLKSIISEILKQGPGVTFYYGIGDEYVHGGRDLEANTFYGDGEVIFFTGSPTPMMRYSATYSNGRCQAFEDMPLQTFREMVAGEK